MEFWRTLFHRTTPKLAKPSYPVRPITPPTGTVTPPAASPLPYQTLTFSSTTFAFGTPSSGTINNALGGTTVVAVGLPIGLTINGPARTWAWDGTGGASTGSFSLYENAPGGTGNPNISVINYTITALRGLKFNIASDSQYVPLIGI